MTYFCSICNRLNSGLSKYYHVYKKHAIGIPIRNGISWEVSNLHYINRCSKSVTAVHCLRTNASLYNSDKRRTKKGLEDMNKSKLINKYSARIRKACVEGINPDYNPRLSAIIQSALNENITKGTINKIIEKAKTTKISSVSKVHFLEYRNSFGVVLYIRVLTDNIRRSQARFNHVLRRAGFSAEKSVGAVRHLFNEIGIIVSTASINGKNVTADEVEEHAIISGAEEVEIKNNYVQFICSREEFFKVKKCLEEIGYTIEFANTFFLPKSSLTLNDYEVEHLADTIQKLFNLDECDDVCTNVH